MRRPVQRFCAAEGCGERSRSRLASFCRRHDYWFQKYGSTDDPRAPRECIYCGVVFTPARVTSRYCSAEACWAEAKRERNRERERRLFAETGEWRGRVQERKNPEIAERRREVKRAEDAVTPQRQRYPASNAARDARRRLRKQQNTPGPVELFTRDELGERDGWVCQLCFEPVDPTLVWPDPRSQSLDHIVPISKGGAHVRENCQIAHLECNVAKSDSLV